MRAISCRGRTIDHGDFGIRHPRVLPSSLVPSVLSFIAFGSDRPVGAIVDRRCMHSSHISLPNVRYGIHPEIERSETES